MKSIRYREKVGVGVAWAVPTKEGSYDLFNSQDIFIGKCKNYGRFWEYIGIRNEYDQKFISFVLNTLNKHLKTPAGSYVYTVFIDSNLRYIGKGSGERFLHALSGTSHVYELNEAYFCNKMIEVFCYADGMTSKNALQLEESLISLWADAEDRNLYNTRSVNLQPNVKPDMKEEALYETVRPRLMGAKVGEDEEYETVKYWYTNNPCASAGKSKNGFINWR